MLPPAAVGQECGQADAGEQECGQVYTGVQEVGRCMQSTDACWIQLMTQVQQLMPWKPTDQLFNIVFCTTALSLRFEPVITSPFHPPCLGPPFSTCFPQLTYHTNLDRLPRHCLLHHCPEPVV